MHSIGSAHAEVRSRRRETSLASTTDRILLIIGNFPERRLGRPPAEIDNRVEEGERPLRAYGPNLSGRGHSSLHHEGHVQ